MDATEAMKAMEAMEATDDVFISLALYASLVLVEPVGARHSERNTPMPGSYHGGTPGGGGWMRSPRALPWDQMRCGVRRARPHTECFLKVGRSR